MTLREKIEVMQAFERGEEIEINYANPEKWTDIASPGWSWGAYNYRVKPKKQTVTIEKWLCKGVDNEYYIVESGASQIMKYHEGNKRKLLDTYEVEL